MADLPNWAWLILSLLGAAFVLGYLRALAAAADDTLSVHRLHHEAATLQIRQFKQLKAIQLGIHPGDIFTSEARLDRLIARAENLISDDKTETETQASPADAPVTPADTSKIDDTGRPTAPPPSPSAAVAGVTKQAVQVKPSPAPQRKAA